MPIHSRFIVPIWTLLLLLQSTPMVFLMFRTRSAFPQSLKFQFWILTITTMHPILTTEYLLPLPPLSLISGATSRPIPHKSAPPSSPPCLGEAHFNFNFFEKKKRPPRVDTKMRLFQVDCR